MNLTWHVMEDRHTLADELARQVGVWLLEDLEAHQRVTLAVSGGQTPIAFFQALSRVILPWYRVDITLVDERWVPVNHERSNEALVRRHLLQNEAEVAHFIGLKTHHESPDAGVAECRQRLATLTRPFSVVVMGMGTDGHTASWFPDSPQLAQALAPEQSHMVVAQHPPSQREPRITLTLPVILEARRRVLHLEGNAKQQVFQQALITTEPVEALPVRALLERDCHLFWSAHES